MKDIKFRIIVYNQLDGTVDFIFIKKLNLFDRLQLGCTKIKTRENTYFVRTSNTEEFLSCLSKTTPSKQSNDSDYDFYCSVVEPHKNSSSIISFDALVSLVTRDNDFNSFEERNNFVDTCNRIKKEQIRKVEVEGDDFDEQYSSLCM